MGESIYSPDMDKQSFYSAATKDAKRSPKKKKQIKQPEQPQESWIARAHANMPFAPSLPVPGAQQADDMDDIILDSLSPQ